MTTEADTCRKLVVPRLQQAGWDDAPATNGTELIEFDFFTGKEVAREAFPTPAELWDRQRAGLHLDGRVADRLLTPGLPDPARPLRCYQETAVNRALQAILAGQRRALLTLCTGAGKTAVAFQICWRLWSAGWNKRGDFGKPKMLFLADRNLLVDDPMEKAFAPFADARFKIEDGRVSLGRDVHFAIYQALAGDAARPGLHREYPRGFFDLIVVDECHRGSARDDSSWREILEWFEPAHQLGLTATPLREESRDTYAYFKAPLYTYSLAQGIADGFLAPYRVHRVVTDYDAAGWRPGRGELDRYGREVPDEEYHTRDFEQGCPARGAVRTRTLVISN